MPPLELRIEKLELPLVHRFTIARSSEDVARTAIFHLRWGALEGLGEAAPSERYGESVETVVETFARRPIEGDDPYRIEELLAGLAPAARCGLDTALHDLLGKDLDRPLWRLLGLDPARTPVTSFTIGIDALEPTLAKVRALRDHPILKIKLGAGRDLETIEAVRSIYTGTLRIDANEAWTAEESVRMLAEMARFDVELCEQPIPAGTPERLRYIHERSPIPVVTDEDSKDVHDLPRLVGCVTGVNIKLVKCGGIRGALEMIHVARALELKIMVGCMVESAVLATAAAQLTPLADWADIDGPFLTAADPYAGLTYENGKLILPPGPGLGAYRCAAAA